MIKNKIKPIIVKFSIAIIIFVFVINLSACALSSDNTSTPLSNGYGAFLSVEESSIAAFFDYDIIAIDAQYYTKDSIATLHNNGVKVYSYLNIGSLEDFRSYYADYYQYTFMDYENWDGERWIDVSKAKWQEFIINTLAKDLKDKGADGVYMDNLDVYSVVQEEYNALSVTDIYEGIKNIIEGVANCGLEVVINGGSDFLSEAFTANDTVLDSIYGYNQEEVFSLITDYDNNKFDKQEEENSIYYQEIITRCVNYGMKIFLLEYSTDPTIITQIIDYCNTNSYYYYISTTVELSV